MGAWRWTVVARSVRWSGADREGSRALLAARWRREATEPGQFAAGAPIGTAASDPSFVRCVPEHAM
jgi:hypothetical protein